VEDTPGGSPSGSTWRLVACSAAALAPFATRRGARGAVSRRAAAQAAQTLEKDEAEMLIAPASVSGDEAPIVGFYEPIQSQEGGPLEYELIRDLGTESGPAMGSRVWIRARVATVRGKGKTTFAVLRQYSLYTLQAVKFKDKDDNGARATQISKFFKGLPLESVVDVCGVLVEAKVNSCTQDNVELQIERAYCVSRASATLPFLLADASRGEAEIQESLETDRPFVRVLQDLRLDSRWLDLRVPANNAIMRVQAAVCRFFRDSLTQRGFTEIHSPKLIAGESEGGAEVFRTDYFGQPASLAQSPQLYKQMAMSADLPGVFEIGPVFRAENSNSPRHLCEFTGLDFEMPIMWHYEEVIEVVWQTLVDVCAGLEKECSAELETIRQMYPAEAPVIPAKPLVLHWEEGMELLKKNGYADRDPLADLSTEEERALGAAVKEVHGADLFLLDRYPSSVRPFYTMPSSSDPTYSNSYDVIFRGQEIGSGAQRCHDPAILEARCEELGVPVAQLGPYIESFRHGVPPHGGVGLGLERIVQLYLGLDNIRKTVMFTRDPSRLSP